MQYLKENLNENQFLFSYKIEVEPQFYEMQVIVNLIE